jgi:divalent metal cation (Fe/Co/Zn/Cd) transporter
MTNINNAIGENIATEAAATKPSNKTLERVGWMSIGINIFLTLLNAVLGMLSGSIAVMAEAVHNLVDLIGSVGVVAGLKLSQKKSTDFPYDGC